MMQSIYHLSDREIKDLTMKEFFIKQKNIPKVAQLYNPHMTDGEQEQKQKNNNTSNAIGAILANNSKG